MSLPLNIVFFTSTSGHFGYLDVYQKTIKHYKRALGGNWSGVNKVYCHVKVKPDQKNRLPDIIDFLLDNDIKPIVTEGDWTRGLNHGEAYLKDIYKVFNTQELHDVSYVMWIEDDSPIHIKQGHLVEYLASALSTLSTNKDILNIRFERDGILNPAKPINNVFGSSNVFDFQPNIGRIRDLYLAAKILQDNWPNFRNVQCEAAFRMASDILSYHPYKYLCFNTNLVSSHHIGAPDYADIIQKPEFATL